MSMEFYIQQMKSRVTFGSLVLNDTEISKFSHHFLVALEWNETNEMQLKYWYCPILHHMKCITCSQILLTCDPKYFQGRIPFKFLQFLIILRRQGRKMALTSLNAYITSHPLRQTSPFRAIGYRAKFWT